MIVFKTFVSSKLNQDLRIFACCSLKPIEEVAFVLSPQESIDVTSICIVFPCSPVNHGMINDLRSEAAYSYRQLVF